ncbi:MAG TPA: hydrogenase maturation protease [Acidimicrobiales bacterium]|nr:hydrogenase maturation protease [Acidimicrobiales bacterium]
MSARVVVAGIGNELRGDDGVGPEVARRVSATTGSLADGRQIEQLGPFASPLELLGNWDGAELAVVVDAVHAEAEPGALIVTEIDTRAAHDDRGGLGGASTHGIGLAGVLRMARALGEAPRRVVLVGVVGEDFGVGCGLSLATRSAVERARHAVLAIVSEPAATCPD